MIQTTITIINKLGLHARAASKFVTTAAAFGSKIQIGKEGTMVDGKSIMSVMLLAASQDSELDLHIDGDDEQRAFEAISDLVNDYFGEGE